MRMRGRGWTAIGLAAVALAAGPAAASGAPAPAGSVVAAGPNGSAQFVWRQAGASGFAQIHERSLSAAGALTDAQSVSSLYRDVFEEQFGVDAAGNAFVAWVQRDGATAAGQAIYVRRRGPDGTLWPSQRVAGGAQLSGLRIAVEPDGDAVMVWERFSDSGAVVQARRRALGGTLGPALTLSYATGYASSPEVDVSPAGRAAVAWVRRGAESSSFVQMRTIGADGTMTDRQSVGPPSAWLSGPHVSVDDAETAVVLWNGPAGLLSRARFSSGRLGVTQTVASGGGYALQRLAGNGAGRTAYVWTEFDSEFRSHLKGRIRQAGGTLGPIFDLVSGAAANARVALDPDGHATFAWNLEDGTRTVQTRRRTTGGSMGPVRTVSAEGEQPRSPDLAVDAAGTATVAYRADATEKLYARTVTPGGAVSPPRWINGDE